MSVRIYTSPAGSTVFPRPTVLRQYVPGRVSRQVRCTRSLSTPLGLEKELMDVPWEVSRRNFTNSFLDTKRREFTSPVTDIKRRDFINSLWEPKTLPLPVSRRRNFYNSPLEIKERESILPLSENKRRDFTNDHLKGDRRDLTNGYLEIKRRDLLTNNNLLENARIIDSCLENRRRDLTGNRLENNGRDLSNSYLDDKGKDLTNNHLESKSKKLIETPRAMRWWNKEKNLCTPDDLLWIILEPTGHYELPTDPCNEVYPGILLSDGPTALCTSMLKRMGVSHVLNAAQGKERPGQVNTSPSFYSHSGIRFLGVEAFDHIAFRLYPYFDEAADFIEEALDSGGKVLVHCRAGISRSATLVCAFLMLKRRLSAQEAIRTVRKNRPIIPNDGFLQQLCDLNERLHKSRGP